MQLNYDYRFCVRASLQVMREQRLKLCNDSITKEPVIYSGLHELDSELQNIYFQYYLIEWFASHWNCMQTILDKNYSYTKDQKKEITLFFAEYFNDILDSIKCSGVLSKLAIPKLLEHQKVVLQELVMCTEKWETNNNKLKVLLKKNKEQFKKLISECEKNNS